MQATDAELRYGFGENWAQHIKDNLSEQIVADAKAHLAKFLRLGSLEGLTFLDIGCGSGLHSLAAHRLGAARIISFDYDRNSVATTEHVRHLAGDPAGWTVMQGSVLDRAFMETLPKSDVVYSWGVLHHTGDMWSAVRNAAIPLKPDGLFYIALYSSDNYVDPPPEFWLRVKRRYNECNALGRRIMEWWYVYRFHMRPALAAGQNPVRVIRDYSGRGMTFWTDVRDWLGGYPMDFASLRETQDFCKHELSLDLVNVATGQGCSEYLFCQPAQNAAWRPIVEGRALIPLTGPFAAQGGACYAASLPSPDMEQQADHPGDPYRSPLMLYEDGRLLGFRHSIHEHIRTYGKGRFSHWGQGIYFAATDNSDPNTNGRTYAYSKQF